MGRYHSTIDLLFDWFGFVCFANKNKNCRLSCSWFQTSQTGGQWYSHTSPLVFPAMAHSSSFWQPQRARLKKRANFSFVCLFTSALCRPINEACYCSVGEQEWRQNFHSAETPGAWYRIHNSQFSSYLRNQPNKLDCSITQLERLTNTKHSN